MVLRVSICARLIIPVVSASISAASAAIRGAQWVFANIAAGQACKNPASGKEGNQSNTTRNITQTWHRCCSVKVQLGLQWLLLGTPRWTRIDANQTSWLSFQR